jgi:voltage-gated potassium channel
LFVIIQLMNVNSKKALSLGTAVSIVILYVVFGATTYHYIEGFRWLDSYYFVVVSLATVGYGDITPHTDLGKLFTIFYLVGGIGIFATLIRYIFVTWREKRVERRKGKKSTK